MLSERRDGAKDSPENTTVRGWPEEEGPFQETEKERGAREGSQTRCGAIGARGRGCLKKV